MDNLPIFELLLSYINIIHVTPYIDITVYICMLPPPQRCTFFVLLLFFFAERSLEGGYHIYIYIQAYIYIDLKHK